MNLNDICKNLYGTVTDELMLETKKVLKSYINSGLPVSNLLGGHKR